ncbi:MAG: pyridoxal 5'-phosphate synthase glutaminase subunit PdxT, partial [Planctomycetota bacterium]
ALQGDFSAHGKIFNRLGVSWREVVKPGDFEEIQGLVIPGGESTTFLKLLDEPLKSQIIALAGRGGAIYGTCAGALLLARKVLNPEQAGLGLLDITIKRNGYGRQAESFVCRRGNGQVEGSDAPEELVFIRAPIIQEVGPEVEVLTRVKGAPVFVKQGRIMATTFHPELTADPTIHSRFLQEMEKAVK